jgi:hypothetical protein
MNVRDLVRFRERVRRVAARYRVEWLADDIASEAVALAFEMPFGGAGKSTRYITTLAIREELGKPGSFKSQVRQAEEMIWEIEREDIGPGPLPEAVPIPAPHLWVDLKAKLRSLPKWKQTAFLRAQTYGGPIPQGSLRRASSAVLKDLRGFLKREYEMEFEDGRAGISKPRLAAHMTPERARAKRKGAVL